MNSNQCLSALIQKKRAQPMLPQSQAHDAIELDTIPYHDSKNTETLNTHAKSAQHPANDTETKHTAVAKGNV
jgi:hypothetical protein